MVEKKKLSGLAAVDKEGGKASETMQFSLDDNQLINVQELLQNRKLALYLKYLFDERQCCDSMPADSQHIRILTVQEVAGLLRIHRSTVSRYAQAGELKSYVIGSRRLFKENDVWAFFENRIALEYASRKEETWQQ
jgi:excisionase family DNA binding protein